MPDIVLSKKAAYVVGVTLLSGGSLFGFLDTRYATNESVSELIDYVHQDRVERYELLIEEAERRSYFYLSIPVEERTYWQKQTLLEEQNRKERYLRKLGRISKPKVIEP